MRIDDRGGDGNGDELVLGVRRWKRVGRRARLIRVAHVKLARVLVGGERGPQQHDLTLEDLDRRAGGDGRSQPLERLRGGVRERSEGGCLECVVGWGEGGIKLRCYQIRIRSNPASISPFPPHPYQSPV